MSMRRIAIALLIVLSTLGHAQAMQHWTADQKADLDRVSGYLTSNHSLVGHFMQIGPDGRAQEGTFYLRRPGRLRFEYNPPSPVLVVADGSTIAVSNRQLHTTDRYPLLGSPLRMLLADRVDLRNDTRVVGVRREPGAISVIARRTNGPANERITITFADSGSVLELRQWEVIDSQGMRTLVVVNDLKQDVDIPARLFVIEDLSPFSHRDD